MPQTKMGKILSASVQLCAILLPHWVKRPLFRFALGWKIGPGTRIGCSIILCSDVRIGTGCRIGHFNLFRQLRILEIGDGTEIVNFNYFMGSPHDDWPNLFSIGNDSKVTSHHFFDSGGGIQIGDLCCVGGRDTQFWTHFLTKVDNIEWRELTIDDRCYVGARATLVYCHIPADSIVGAGAVVTKDFSTQGTGLLLVGNPAVVKRRNGSDAQRFA
jgi:acetyltransferase-like isoleucine patch superfamily enzyme